MNNARARARLRIDNGDAKSRRLKESQKELGCWMMDDAHSNIGLLLQVRQTEESVVGGSLRLSSGKLRENLREMTLLKEGNTFRAYLIQHWKHVDRFCPSCGSEYLARGAANVALVRQCS